VLLQRRSCLWQWVIQALLLSSDDLACQQVMPCRGRPFLTCLQSRMCCQGQAGLARESRVLPVELGQRLRSLCERGRPARHGECKRDSIAVDKDVLESFKGDHRVDRPDKRGLVATAVDTVAAVGVSANSNLPQLTPPLDIRCRSLRHAAASICHIHQSTLINNRLPARCAGQSSLQEQ
jgi:hypothetical protein